jgi:hypothetical protein
MPGGDRDAIGRQEIEKVAAGEARGSGDEDRGRAQCGIPFIPPLKGDTLPRPASVSEMKNM